MIFAMTIKNLDYQGDFQRFGQTNFLKAKMTSLSIAVNSYASEIILELSCRFQTWHGDYCNSLV